MVTVNRHRRRAACPGNTSIDNLEEGGSDMIVPLLSTLFKQVVFNDADKNFDDN